MHDCPICGDYCDCDMEDHHQPAPPDCMHECDDEDTDDYEDRDDDDD